MNIKTVVDKERGCGWRKPGGLYLRCDAPASPCGRLPLKLEVCPCCSAGFKPCLGWTWVDLRLMFKYNDCKFTTSHHEDRCDGCLINHPEGKAGLLWIGGSFYETPEAWSGEAMRLGVSRRISSVPNGFVLGETIVLVAHRKVPKIGKAVFSAFRPERIEYVVRGDEPESKLAALTRRGITLVNVVRDGTLPGVDAEAERNSSAIDRRKEAL